MQLSVAPSYGGVYLGAGWGGGGFFFLIHVFFYFDCF